MAAATPIFSAQEFLRVIDGTPLGPILRARNKDLLDRMDIFRREMGDNCNYTKACLQVAWANEVANDAAGFYRSLKDAGYSS